MFQTDASLRCLQWYDLPVHSAQLAGGALHMPHIVPQSLLLVESASVLHNLGLDLRMKLLLLLLLRFRGWSASMIAC
jgi:hypothetical protein